MLSIKNLSRRDAFISHLIISLVIFLVLAFVIYKIWFPGFLFWVDGGFEGIRLIAGVDLVLGPLLTLIIYRQGKPGLAFDIGLIATIQIICLAIGVFIVHQNKTIAVLFSHGIFYAMDQAQVESKPGLSEKIEALPGNYPKFIYVDESRATEHLPTENAYNAQRYLSELYNPQLYTALYEQNNSIFFDKGFSYEQMLIKYPNNFKKWITEKDYVQDSISMYELVAKYAHFKYYLIVDKEDGKILDYWPKRFDFGIVSL